MREKRRKTARLTMTTLAPVGVENRKEAIRPTTGNRKHGRAKHHPFKALEQAHRAQRRKDDKAGNEQSAHNAHADDNGNGGQRGDEKVVKVGFDADGFSKCLVKGDGKDLLIKTKEQNQHNQRKDDGQCNIGPAHGQNTAEHIVIDIRAHAGGEGCSDDADGQGRGGNKRNGGIGFDAAASADAKQQKCGQQNDGHGNGHGRKVERGGHGKSAEANMGQPVADHRIPLEYQADAQQRRA